MSVRHCLTWDDPAPHEGCHCTMCNLVRQGYEGPCTCDGCDPNDEVDPWSGEWGALETGGRHWHWFDHPEMQARIAEAEADLREGRTHRFSSRDELMAYLDSLK